MNEFFMGHDSYKMLADEPCGFSLYFDWILTRTKLIQRKKNPGTIYTKTDFLPTFVNKVLPAINSHFVLITGCSDYSPEINFPSQYRVLTNHPFMRLWYMENKFSQHPKVKSLPVGLATHTLESEYLLLRSREEARILKCRKEKVFCCWRAREHNVVGSDHCVRPKIYRRIRNSTGFDWFEPNFKLYEFYKKLSEYKFSLCPNGNGLDPAPTAWASLALGVIPIISASVNSVEIYGGIADHVILFDSLDDLHVQCFQDLKKKPLPDLSYLSSSFWSQKILAATRCG